MKRRKWGIDMEEEKNIALKAEQDQKAAVESAYDYLEHFDILETITNVGNDEVFTPRKTCEMILDSLPDEVWHNPDYKWLNPATKNGIFEREIAIRLDRGLREAIPDEETRRKHILQNMIYAIGLTKFTSYVARRTLYYCSDANRKCDGIKAPDGHYVNGYAIGNGTWFDDKEGNIKTPRAEHAFDKNERCIYCRLPRTSKYVDSLQREQYAYEFIHHKPEELLTFLQDLFFKGDRNMKFDIIITNPPYQLSDGGARASARPIYQLFIQNAIALNPKYLSMIVPSRWMVGGKGLDLFRAQMLSDRHIKILHDYLNPKECFPNNEINGGVCYFVWSNEYQGKTEIYTHRGDEISKSARYLNEGAGDIFIRFEELISIKDKALAHSPKTLDSMVSASKPYGLRAETMLCAKKYGLPEFCDFAVKNGYSVLGLDNRGQRTTKYIAPDYPLPKISACARKYKVFIAEADGAAGQIGNPIPARIIGKPTLGKPNEICTETFLEIGPFDTSEQAENVCKYIKTRFFRCLVGIQKQTQHTTQKVYRFVPIQNFTSNSDIDWSKSIASIDQQLFLKYKLSEEEIRFIETMVQEMN